MCLEKRKMKWYLMNADICLCGDTEIKGGLLWWFSGKKICLLCRKQGLDP